MNINKHLTPKSATTADLLGNCREDIIITALNRIAYQEHNLRAAEPSGLFNIMQDCTTTRAHVDIEAICKTFIMVNGESDEPCDYDDELLYEAADAAVNHLAARLSALNMDERCAAIRTYIGGDFSIFK